MIRLPFAMLATASLAALVSAQAAVAQSVPEGAIQLEDITVQGAGAGGGQGAPGVVTNDGYVAKTTRTGTKTDTPINELPATVNVVTQKQLEDRRPQDLREALSYTPGAQVGLYGFDPRYDSFYIRGVDVTYTGIFRDGLRQFNSPNGITRLEPYGLEAISILKGPSSAIYGASSSVGIIDLISKRPKDYAFAEVEAQTGSYERLQGAFDFGGPANEAGTVLYRFTGLGRNAGTEVRGVNDNRVFVAPAITIKPHDDTKITFLAEYLEGLTGGSAAYQNIYTPDFKSLGALKIPLAFKDFNDFNQKQGRIGYEFEHSFNEFVSLHQNLRYSFVDTRQEYSGSQFLDTGLIKEEFGGIAADTYLLTKASTGPVDHKILTGVDISYLKYNSKLAFGGVTDPENIPTPSFDEDSSFPRSSRQDQTLIGVYAQDELAWERWRLTAGARYDWFDSDFNSLTTIFVPATPTTPAGFGRVRVDEQQNDGKFTGRIGLSYVSSAGFTPYASYGTSFVPNPGTVIGGAVTRPTVGEQVEAGVKYAVPGKNASISASVFTLKQEDGLVFAVVNGVNAQTQLDFRSRGFEIEGTATLTNGVSLIANYTFSDVTIDAPDSIEGKRLTGVPKHAFAIWAGYEVKDGVAKGLGLGAGVRYTGQSFGDNENRSVISNDPRAFVDAKVSYEFENLNPRLKGVSAQVNATNLFDQVKQVCVSNYCYFNEGRKVIASLKYRW